MVSGFLTSPYDQERISSGEAIPIRIFENVLASAIGYYFLVLLLKGRLVVSQAQGALAAARGGFDRILVRIDVVVAVAQVDLAVLLVQHRHFQAETLQLVDQNLERLRHARL